ncbi:hypothetical protein [Adonisia turfae]|uniref:Uncharacterized protein n=1 Tax=Adonisia turfae CCMR0081 TaxID=2292702 RepID=A0A6M0RXZ8_9CYAN|nr:hypothetical protein [Adonisia turfae]NEZ61069.1 hypothetical protein [Adonisia turfae CCMR0081]
MNKTSEIIIRAALFLASGWIVNQLPEIDVLSIELSNVNLFFIAFCIAIILAVIENNSSDQNNEEATDILNDAIIKISYACLLSLALFFCSNISSAPKGFSKTLQYSAVITLVWGVVVTVLKTKVSFRTNPEESRDILSETFLRGEVVLLNASRSVVQPISDIIPSHGGSKILRKTLERQSYIQGKINELRNRFEYRKQAFNYMRHIVDSKSFSRDISLITLEKYISTSSSSDLSNSLKEQFRMQLNLHFESIAISIKFGRPNAINKILENFSSQWVLDPKVYEEAFLIAKQRVRAVAIQDKVSIGAIAQIERHFEYLIEQIQLTTIAAY